MERRDLIKGGLAASLLCAPSTNLPNRELQFALKYKFQVYRTGARAPFAQSLPNGMVRRRTRYFRCSIHALQQPACRGRGNQEGAQDRLKMSPARDLIVWAKRHLTSKLTRKSSMVRVHSGLPFKFESRSYVTVTVAHRKIRIASRVFPIPRFRTRP